MVPQKQLNAAEAMVLNARHGFFVVNSPCNRPCIKNLKLPTAAFLSLRVEVFESKLSIDMCTRLARFYRQTRDCIPLSSPIARTLVVSFARVHLSFSIQVGSLLRHVKILDTGHHVKVRTHRPADKKTGIAKYPGLQERQKLPSSTALLGHNHALFKISNCPKTLSWSKVLY